VSETPLTALGAESVASRRLVLDHRRELGHDARERYDVQDALTASQEVHDLAVGVRENGRAPGEDQRGRLQVGAERVAQALDGLSRASERNPGVEEGLDDLDLDEIFVRVPTLRTTPLGREASEGVTSSVRAQ
jgi:hypothetical protein